VNTPRFLIAAALLFWGWQTEHIVLGIIAGAILESSRFIKVRWSLTQSDFNRLWNVCTVLFIGIGVYLLISEGTITYNDFFVNAGKRPEAIRQAGKSALVWFQWLPMVFLPFMLAQAFNERDRVGLATFSWWLRRQEKQNPQPNLPREELNVAFPYLAACLLAASASTRGGLFYFGIAVLLGWAFWPSRTNRYPALAWSVAFLFIAALGYGGHIGLFRLQKKLEEMNVAWFSRLSAIAVDLKEVRMQLGSIGRLKMSDRIVLRVRTDGRDAPELLREASYNLYSAALWRNPKRELFPVLSDDNSTWKLLQKDSRRSVTVAQYLRRGEGVLALPPGSSQISNLTVGALNTNLFGTAKAEAGPGLVIYSALYDNGATFDSAPQPDDLRSYAEAEPAVAQVAQELQLRPGMPAADAMKRVAALFQDKFQYATYLTTAHAATSNETALARFLLHMRSGHCEYFATATALLLRHAGLPTRYAVGYSVQEGSGRKFVVRERHAHAWTLVWDGRNWIDFDTTPSSWNAVESKHSSWLQPVNDLFSNLWFQFSKFRWSKTEWRKYFMWAPVPLLLIVLARFFLGKQWKRVRARRDERAKQLQRQGIDSDFYLIEKHLAARGLERRASETWSAWLRRIEAHESAVAPLHRVLALHQRHRFDPRGLSENERAELRTEVSRWLARQRR
jgi:protein-glutamine gamma-glutamyltransferase